MKLKISIYTFLLLLCTQSFSQTFDFRLLSDSYSYGCFSKEVEFIITDDICPENKVCEYNWNFGDGNTKTYYKADTIIKNNYSTDGSFTVSVSITDTSTYEQLGTKSIRNIVTIYNPEEAIIDFEQFESEDNPFFSFHYRFFPKFESIHKGLWAFSWNIEDISTFVQDTVEVIFPFENLDPGYEVVLTTKLITDRLDMSLDYLEKYGLSECFYNTTSFIVVTDEYFENPLEEIIEKRTPYQPNIFTPNGDGINDKFFLDTNGEDLFSLFVYNRWGSLVYEKKDVKEIIWDGVNMSSKPVPSGTYFYVVVSNKSDGRHEMKGTVNLFR